jgi:hypothetical protein
MICDLIYAGDSERHIVYTGGGITFWIAGQISRKNGVAGRKEINETKFMLVLPKKRLTLHVYLQNYIPKT